MPSIDFNLHFLLDLEQQQTLQITQTPKHYVYCRFPPQRSEASVAALNDSKTDEIRNAFHSHFHFRPLLAAYPRAPLAKPLIFFMKTTENVLAVERQGEKTVIRECLTTYPFRLIAIESWKPHTTLSMLGFGGGMVTGDQLYLNIAVGAGSTLFMRTQGNTKIFKCSPSQYCKQAVAIRAEERSLTVWAPDLTTCFEDSDFRQTLSVHLSSPLASCVLVDWYSSGRKDRDSFWGMRRLSSFLSLSVDGVPVFVDHTNLQQQRTSPSSVSAFEPMVSIADRMGYAEVSGLVLLAGPRTACIRHTLLSSFTQRQTFHEHRRMLQFRDSKSATNTVPDTKSSSSEKVGPNRRRQLVAVTKLSAETVLLRFHVASADYAYQLLHQLLLPLREHLHGTCPYADRVLPEADERPPRKRRRTLAEDGSADSRDKSNTTKESSDSDPDAGNAVAYDEDEDEADDPDCPLSQLRRHLRQQRPPHG